MAASRAARAQKFPTLINMASYARAQAFASKNQMPTMLVKAKPAVISSNGSGYSDDDVAGILSEKINTALRFAPDTKQELDMSTAKFNYTDQKAVKHIEDDVVLQKQNASNQMRQAAVMAAVASQQKVRLTAKERLALTAKRPMTNQQINQQPPRQTAYNQQPSQPTSATLNSTLKQTSLPTLETLLAVQRQLQQHTKQHLNNLPQQVVTDYKPETNGSSSCRKTSLQQSNKPLPPSPLRTPSPIKQVDHDIETYDKDLPPLPASISPSTSTDDSQLNSLESHQSSPATSLVSIPPPPPPISSYLEQYDEVNNACQQQTIHSVPSSPSTISSVSDVSSVRKFPAALPIKSVPEKPTPNHETSFNLPLPYFSQSSSQVSYKNDKMSTDSQRPVHQYKPPAPLPPMQTVKQDAPPIQQLAVKAYQSLTANQRLIENLQSNSVSAMTQHRPANGLTPQEMNPPSPQLTQLSDGGNNQIHPKSSTNLYKPPTEYSQHVFSGQTARPQSNNQFLPPPPPPLTDGDFDEPDSGSFRFPTPPPPDLLLPEVDDGIEDDDDDDFQCKIPTPPPYKSAMSATSFTPSELDCHQRAGVQSSNYKSASPIFNSSTFTASSATHVDSLQPPLLFRQQQQQLQSVTQTTSNRLPATTPQLTVRIGNNEVEGLLSTTINSSHNRHHQNANHLSHHHHHHMMMAMTASSSSPSSSSDGDGQSTNSSSSTSGIHSSIDSPSSSSSKLVDDFNYACKLKKLASNHGIYKESHRKKSSTTSLQPSPVPANTATNASAIRPALKQKKTVSFSDKVELVACADEQSEDHLPNPLLARVLAGKLQ